MGQPPNEINRPNSPAYNPSLPSSPTVQPAQPASPASNGELDDEFGHNIYMSSPPRVDKSQASASDLEMSDPKSDEDEELDDPYGLDGINMEMEHNYPFDQLLDDPPNEYHNPHYLFGVDIDDIEHEAPDLNVVTHSYFILFFFDFACYT